MDDVVRTAANAPRALPPSTDGGHRPDVAADRRVALPAQSQRRHINNGVITGNLHYIVKTGGYMIVITLAFGVLAIVGVLGVEVSWASGPIFVGRSSRACRPSPLER